MASKKLLNIKLQTIGTNGGSAILTLPSEYNNIKHTPISAYGSTSSFSAEAYVDNGEVIISVVGTATNNGLYVYGIVFVGMI